MVLQRSEVVPGSRAASPGLSAHQPVCRGPAIPACLKAKATDRWAGQGCAVTWGGRCGVWAERGGGGRVRT